MIGIQCLDGSDHQHHIFYFIKLSHSLIIFHTLEKSHQYVTLIGLWLWSVQTPFSLNIWYQMLEASIFILSIFIQYSIRSIIWETTKNTLTTWYVQILNGKWTHCFIYRISCLIMEYFPIWNNLLTVPIIYLPVITNRPHPRMAWKIGSNTFKCLFLQ